MENNQKAIENFKLSLKYNELIGDKDGVLSSLLNMSDAYMRLKLYDKALYYTEMTLQRSKKYRINSRLLTIYDNFMEVHRNIGAYQLALKHQLERETIKDSLFGIEMEKHISELETKYETEKKGNSN